MNAQTIINIARGEIGTVESPAHSNNVKYNTEYYGHPVYGDADYPWCCTFVWWVFKKAGASELFYGGDRCAGCTTLASYYKERGQFLTSNPVPGDLALFQFDNDSYYDHIGIVVSVDANTITTIDGNTSPGTSGSQDNGGGVYQRTRSRSVVGGYIRPAYTGAGINFTNAPLQANYVVTSPFGYRAGGNHKGIDLGVEGNPNGTIPVVSVAQGTVTRADFSSSYGNVVYIDHGQGIVTRYAHLYNLAVRKSDIVNGGTFLGYMGSTGDSSNPHLHFEVLVNGKQVDPAPYINGNAIVSREGSSSSSIFREGDDFIPPSTVDIGGVVVGQRVSEITTQPLYAYVKLFIGDDLQILSDPTGRNNIIQSFEYNRLESAGETATITIYDDNWDEIEGVLTQNWDRVYIEYGYEGGLKSPLVRHLLGTYSIDFENSGTILHISTLTTGAYENLSQVTLDTDTYNPTVAVKAICNALGWKVLEENFDPSQDVTATDPPFNLVEDNPVSFINDIIIPQASQEGEEVFYFYLDPDNTAHFKRLSFEDYMKDTMRTYIYQRGYDSTVIDLSFDIKGVFGASEWDGTATDYRVSLFDTQTKEQNSHEVTNTNVITQATGDTVSTRSDQSNPIVDAAGSSSSQMKNTIYYRMKSDGAKAYSAQMTIIGDPTIKLFEYVRIINITDSGHLHHTSGVYWVSGITDSVSADGQMITSLRLNRNAYYTLGEDSGLEIINPKYFIK